MAEVVLVHGANHGGWCWERLVPLLEAAGHRVYAPTLTGLAERAAELTPDVGLETHVDDIASLIEGEGLQNVVLVAHSAAGAVVPGVSERCEARISHLVFLDAFLPGDGESVLDVEPPGSREAFLAVARDQGDGWRIPRQESLLDRWGLINPADRRWVWERLTDMPLRACTDPVEAPGGAVQRLPRAFIDLTDPKNPGVVPSTARACSQGLKMMEIETGHEAMITEPAQLAATIDLVARS